MELMPGLRDRAAVGAFSLANVNGALKAEYARQTIRGATRRER